MSTTQQDQDKSSGKPRQRGRKADQRGKKNDQQQSPKLDQPAEGQIGAMVASTETPAIEVAASTASTETPAIEVAASTTAPLIGEVLPPDVVAVGAAAPVEIYPVSLQTIANAYAGYTMKSIEESRFFVEKLIGVRSFDKAIEVQSEFARQVCANFVMESQRMCELYGALARQIFWPWERFAAKLTGRPIL
ncbi:MAG: phasin family protein [Bradyrhizobium sp.]